MASSSRGRLIELSCELVVNLPTVAQLDLAYAVGKQSGHEVDKFAVHDTAVEPASLVAAPLARPAPSTT